MKEYLVKQYGGGYFLTKSVDQVDDWIEVPDGAELCTLLEEFLIFWKGTKNKRPHYDDWLECNHTVDDYLKQYKDAKIVWQRHTQPESLPFIDDEVQGINDQYAEIEKVRQAAKDNVNHPSHYADSAIECIDAMEAMMTPEQFIGYLRGNLFKYQWRYEKKNGIEDLKKAQWYLEKLTVKIAEKNAMF